MRASQLKRLCVVWRRNMQRIARRDVLDHRWNGCVIIKKPCHLAEEIGFVELREHCN